MIDERTSILMLRLFRFIWV